MSGRRVRGNIGVYVRRCSMGRWGTVAGWRRFSIAILWELPAWMW
jgi:hypothetical protein